MMKKIGDKIDCIENVILCILIGMFISIGLSELVNRQNPCEEKIYETHVVTQYEVFNEKEVGE